MADPAGNSGIRAAGLRPVAILKKDNYRAWSTKLKVQLKVMECWELVTGAELQPPDTAPAGANAVAVAAALALRKSWDRRNIASSAVLITSISDEELHTVHGLDDFPPQIWTRPREKFDRRSEAEAETAFMSFLDFAHLESETADELIERYETALQRCTDQGVALDPNTRLRMLLGRPAERYKFLKQNFMLAGAAARPGLEVLKAQLRDIDAEYRKPLPSVKTKDGQGHRTEAQANWGQKSNPGADRRREKYSVRGGSSSGSRGGRGSGDRGNGREGAAKSSSEVTCYCCGKKGHIKPDCPKKMEECRQCGKVGHLQSMCKSKSEGGTSSTHPEAGLSEEYDGFSFDVTIGAEAMVVDVAAAKTHFSDIWLGDTGASAHIKSSSENMINVTKCPPGTKIRQVQGSVVVEEWGTVLLEVDGTGGKHVIKLEETLIVPGITVNLFSLQRVLDLGYLLDYGEVANKCIIKKLDSTGAAVQMATMTVIKGRSTLDCDYFTSTLRTSGPAPQIDTFRGELNMQLLHRRMGHSGIDAMKKLLFGKLARGIDSVRIADLQPCDFCKQGKLSRGPHPAADVSNKGSRLLDLVVVDLAGPNRPQTLGRKLYDMVIVDTFSQRFFVILLARKSDAAAALMRWIPQVEVETGRKLHRLRSDNGGEFLSDVFTEWLSLRGVTQQTTPSYSPQSNGIAERGNRTLQDKARTMLLESGLSGSLWGEIILTSCFLRNLSPTSSLAMTPLEMWTGRRPSVQRLKVVGCKAYCQYDERERVGKFSAKAWIGVLVGYSVDTPGYRVWDPSTHKVWDVRAPDFDETVSGGWWRKLVLEKELAWGEDEPIEFVYKENPPDGPPMEQLGAVVLVPPAADDAADDDGANGGGDGGLLDDVNEDDDDAPLRIEGAPVPNVPRMSQRENRGVPPLRLIEIMLAAEESDNGGAPATYQEALSGPEGKEWKKAFDAEVESLNENKVYTVVDRPAGKKVVRAKWVLRRKLLPGGKLDKLKARIVAKGFTQREGIDYDETYSPTVRFGSVRLMVAAAAAGGMHTHQMDVTTAFLYASLDEEVYMELMEGMDGYGEPGKVARLWKAIYGLKQASRMWNQHIDGVLASMGFVRLTGDHGVYVKWDGVNRVWLALYVDDLFLISLNLANITESKKTLGADMKT